MARRRNSDDIEFGSDSFLDIVANIVGILIILIVVAGIKAGAAPVSAERLSEYLRTHVKPAPPKVEPAPVTANAAPQPGSRQGRAPRGRGAAGSCWPGTWPAPLSGDTCC